jgi:hypothetical protein
MSKKTGSQVSKANVLGVECDVVDIDGTLMLTKRGLQRAIEWTLRVTDRQARAAVSSYIAEGWTEVQPRTRPRINDGICEVSSAVARVTVHADRSEKARVENGQKGGRPSGPSTHMTHVIGDA